VLGRDTLQGDNEVLERALLLVAPERLAVHEVVEALAVLEHVVDTAHDAEDTEREDPDTDDTDDRSLLATLEPTEDAEEGSNNVDDEDGAGQLPRGKRRPEWTVGTAKELVSCNSKKKE
jgi:hypothetical protein